MLLSDRDIRTDLASGRIGLDPFDDEMIQPSSVDVRLDHYFRLFDNHKYPVIDPSLPQPELTRLVEVDPEESFMLHPGEFVLASTLEVVTLGDDVAARLEGKSSLGDRKSTRLNSSHVAISYAVFCLKKKKNKQR